VKTATLLRRVAVIGNPNTGKTTLFNALTGLSQRVGNYPGVTVEKKTGALDEGTLLIDLPGTYSLAAWSPDEMIAVSTLLAGPEHGGPDLVIVVVDAGNLERTLYLATQVLETGRPVVIALNMVDAAERGGITVDADALSRALGVPVVPTVARSGQGLDALRAAVHETLGRPAPEPPCRWPEPVEREAGALAARAGVPMFLARRALVDQGGAAEALVAAQAGPDGGAAVAGARARAEAALSGALAAAEARMRYGWLAPVAAACATRRPAGRSWTDRIDAVLTHRALGSLALVGVMSTMFLSVFQWAAPLMDLIERGFQGAGELVSRALAGTPLAGGLLESLLVQGVLAGVGGVLVFLPQIAILFLFIALLEDCGYLARAAFLMDRLLRFCGLSGHSFIPMLSSFACAVPGIMATRTIGDRRNRLTTILITPLLSCSARIPIYALLISAFVPASMVAGFLPLQGLVFAAMYFVGIVVAVPVAWLVQRTLLRGPPAPFVMELPPYQWPSPRTVALRVLDRCRAFVVRAGTLIFAFSILIWALGTFPRSGEARAEAQAARERAAATLGGEALRQREREIANREAGELLRQSALGRMGRALEPVFAPLGWDWRIGMATLASFPAREVVVSTLRVIYDLGEAGGDDERDLADTLAAARRPDGRPAFDLAVALSLLVFFALCCQCFSTLVTIKRETNSWRWPVFTFAYMTALAYAGAFATRDLAALWL
jgi:ferrous iron transport protein B